MSKQQEYVSATEAASLLGIKKESLYTYVSRQLIRSINDPNDKKAKLYLFTDIQKFISRRNTPTTEKIVKQSLLWGMPVLESSITLIEDNILYYKGISVAQLVKKNSLEQVAKLIWTGDISNSETLFSNRTDIVINTNLTLNRQEIQNFLLVLDKHDLSFRKMEDIPDLGAKIILSIISNLTQNASNESIDIKLAKHFCPKDKNAPELIRTALILIADHELNASSFTARVVASTGANLYQVIIAGLAALSGYKHGANSFKVETMLRELRMEFAFEKNLRSRLDRGEQIVGFGHNLYPGGDFRAKILLELLQRKYSANEEFTILMTIKKHCQKSTNLEPNIDFALVCLAKILGQNAEFSFLLFALGRIIGWVGQAIEEYNEKRLIRPRARYIGPRPK